MSPPPGRVIGKGHPAGDFLGAPDWKLLEEHPGYLRIEAVLPDQLKNPLGQLFGGFTPTYVDLVALLTVRSGWSTGGGEPEGPRQWLATTSMRVEYFLPVVGPGFVVEGVEEYRRTRTHVVTTRFFQGDALAVLALTTMREVAAGRSVGDA